MNFVVGVVVHGVVAAAGPSGLEGLSGGRSLAPPGCAVLVLGEVDELEVGSGLKSVGGRGWFGSWRC